MPVFSDKYGGGWTFWEMKISPYLMEKGLDVYLDPEFKDRLPIKENGPFNLTIELEKFFKEAVDLNKKTMGSVPSSVLNNEFSQQVQSAEKADKLFLSGRVWNLWQELQTKYNPNNSVT